MIAALLAASTVAVPAAVSRAAGPSLSVAPAVGEIAMSAGQTVTESVTVTNRSDTSVEVIAAVGDIVQSDDGSFAVRQPQSQPDSAAGWVTVTPGTLTLERGASNIVTVSINAPVGEVVGGHYAGVLFSAEGQRVLHSILIELQGEGIAAQGRVLGITMPRIEATGRVPFRIQVQNVGNTHLALQGTIEVQDRVRNTRIARIPVPKFYVLPGKTSGALVIWRDPPIFAPVMASAELALAGAPPEAVGGRVMAETTGLVIVWWLLSIAGALVLLLLRLFWGLISPRRRRARRERRERRRAAQPVAAPAPAPAPLPGPAPSRVAAAVGSQTKSVWVAPQRTQTTTNGIALRRASAALRLLREGAGRSGVRVDVAVGLLRTVEDIPAVRGEIEAAYGDAVGRRAYHETATIALALVVVDSVEAPAALLRAYARADSVLAARLRRALAQVDPADIRSHPDLIEALPPARKQALPVG